jgi:nitrous oxidase accessory protein
MALATSVSAATLVVNPATPGAYAEIQAAVDAAAPGDIIMVATGVYAPVTIATDNLTIKASPGQTPLVDAEGAEVAVWVQSDNVKISGLTVINAGDLEEEVDAFGFLVTGNRAHLRGNTAENSVYGFSISGSSSTLVGNSATGCVIGIELYNGSGHQVVNNTATGNAFGMGLFDTSHNTVANNELSGNDTIGLWASATFAFNIGANHNKITNNNASDNFIGIAMTFGTGNHFSGNTSDRNGFDGIRIRTWAPNNVFTGNRSRDNGRLGVWLEEGTENCTFRGMVLTGNGEGPSNVPLR